MAEHQHDYQLPVAFQAWQRDETGSGWHLLVRSAEMTDVPATREAGFDEHEQQGALWRFYTVDHDHGRYRVIVGQQHATRYRLAGEIALHLLLPILIGLPLIAIGIWVVVGRALRPVDTVARAVGGLDARHLAPVRIDGPLPAEIAPLVGSLDALVVRLAEALDNERRFTPPMRPTSCAPLLPRCGSRPKWHAAPSKAVPVNMPWSRSCRALSA
jgi:two-component system sensor histidine kinase QseC